MVDVTRILAQIEDGDASASSELMPLVYKELRKLAAARLRHENPNQTLQATALVHEAYIRLVDVKQQQRWESRGHFLPQPQNQCVEFLLRTREDGVPKSAPEIVNGSISMMSPLPRVTSWPMPRRHSPMLSQKIAH